ncbi:major capsid protein [Microviridae sp.]|nr:major capsid protein [Microviridae sp.]
MPATRPHQTVTRPYQPDVMRKRTAPIMHERMMRPMNVGAITSSMAGKLVPLSAVGLHREDGMRTSRFAITVQMEQTAAMLINPVRVTARAFFVPKLAFERFKDMGSIDRSYNGEQEVDGQTIPWFENEPAGTNEVYQALGVHRAATEVSNSDYLEAYNLIWNHLAAERSPSLTLRTKDEMTLAPAFWSNSQLKHVVPTFDDALIAGEVPVQVIGDDELSVTTREAGTDGSTTTMWRQATDPDNPGQVSFGGSDIDANHLVAQLNNAALQINVADIALARESAAWARLRTQFSGISEEWMIDQLLSGIRVRDETLNHPIELDRSEGVVGMTQRFATEAANLDQSMTDGSTVVSLTAGLPAITCGGVFMVVGQVLPEMQYERQKDFYLSATTVADLPNRTSDELDPQPVEMVKNVDVDSSHSDPEGLFGYRPLNGKWLKRHVNLGGKYYRSDPSAAWDENRNRIWTPEVVDPALGPDFYLSNTLSHSVFVDSLSDQFEWWVTGVAQVEGLTYFGPALREAVDDYDKVIAQVPQERLKGDGTDVPAAQGAQASNEGSSE